MTTAICPGSFDPVTVGHVDIIRRARKMFDHVIVAVLVNPTKNPSFSLEERIGLLKRATKEIDGLEIVGFDGLLNYYKGRNDVCDLAIEKAFMEHVGWNELLPKPYFIDADKTLFEHFRDVTREGITIAAPGFYAPQGRWVRLEPQDARLNEKIESFDYHGRRITNFEMEGSALAGLAALMGHRAATICTIIAQRIAQNVDTDYKPFVRKMISTALDKLAVLE